MPVPPSGINGIHHLTGISRDARRTVDFYTGWPGLRLIKQTVNFDKEALAVWRDYLNASGVPTTEIMDRAYFRSISFHDPDGQIVEIATDTPGSRADETEAELGRTLQLPSWLRPRPSEIERSLTPIAVRDPIGR